MFKVILSAALLVSYTLAADSCTANDIAGLNNCYQAFVGAYGFSMSNVLPHYWDMHQVRTGWLDAQGVKVQPKICQIGNNLVNCIVKFPCLSQDTFLTMGADSTESPRWFLDKIATKYQCGEGYQVLLPRLLLYGGLPATNDMITCQAQIYSTYCDFNSGAFNCGLNEAVIKETQPACTPALQMCPKFQFF
ncbi:unnamed protein product, partial [Mesorhabditis belari]|uniref:Secreted protein n=1 Tax=Mesorhabditis belari TaxID=2138241 RepID=A0AAF3ED51_9BILA